MHQFFELFVFLLTLSGSAIFIALAVQRFTSRRLEEHVSRAESEGVEFSLSSGAESDSQTRSTGESPAHISESALYAPPPIIAEEPIDPQYDWWVDYPPDWNARRMAAKKRDGFQCQILGCPSIGDVDVHHIDPVESGSGKLANHQSDNLVCLCLFHHFLADNFHPKVAERIHSPRYKAVPSYDRLNRRNRGDHRVDAHVQRISRASDQELKTIKARYGLECGSCGGSDFRMKTFPRSERLRVTCVGCLKAWSLFWGLAEEVGPPLTLILRATPNKVRFPLLELKNFKFEPPVPVIMCKDCASKGVLVMLVARRSGFGKFWGCPNWDGNKKHYTQRWSDGDEDIAKEIERLF